MKMTFSFPKFGCLRYINTSVRIVWIQSHAASVIIPLGYPTTIGNRSDIPFDDMIGVHRG